jgi:hypothetical protein
MKRLQTEMADVAFAKPEGWERVMRIAPDQTMTHEEGCKTSLCWPELECSPAR